MKNNREKYLVFFGTPEFAVTVLDRLQAGGLLPDVIVTQPDRPQGRRMKLTPPPAKLWAQKHSIPCFQPERAQDEKFLEQLRTLVPDVILTASYGQILSQELLDIPTIGCLNIHPSLLPLYRGAAPVQSSIIAGEAMTGVTVMEMEAGMDSGPILAQREYPIAEHITSGELLNELAVVGADLVLELYPAYLKGEVKAIEQDHEKATFANRLNRDTGQIDWSLPAREIHNLIRGTQPWPGAYTFCQGKRLKIISSRVIDDSNQSFADPGTLICCDKTLTVAAGTGLLDLEIIQPAGGKVMSCCECAHNYTTGIVLGG